MTRALITVVLLGVLTVVCGNADAQCRKVTPPGGAFGIESGTLCSFGSDEGRVLPDYGYNYNTQGEEPIYSYKEQRGMLRGQYARNRRGPSDGLLNQAINSSYRPLGGVSRRTPLVVRIQ
jgi:hypothetical protein